MSTTFTRRGLLAAGAALATAPLLPTRLQAAADVRSLVATSRTLDVRGRAVSVMGLIGSDGRPGLVLEPGERFRVDLVNRLAEPTIIHWHGQIPPAAQDGVPDVPLSPLAPGEARSFDFVPRIGTHWMHSHMPLQEMALLAAPLIVRGPEDLAEDRQEVVMFLHDLSFASPEEVLAGLGIGAMAGMDHGAPANTHDMGAMTGMEGMATMDVNDIAFDAYLANDRTLDDPEVVTVERGGRVRLRIINAAAATAFWIDMGAVPATLVAVDGEAVEPIAGERFGLAMGQRLDLVLDLPSEGGAFPILALREAAPERAGIVLATPGAAVPRLPVRGDSPSAVFDADFAQESKLRARVPLPERPAQSADTLMLQGSMSPYLWSIDGRPWPEPRVLQARSGERVELTFHNMSMMAHPMHLHGHAFQVVGINERRFRGAVRDTVLVPPMAAVTVAFDAGEAARWMLHCHHMPHLATGMMTELQVSA